MTEELEKEVRAAIELIHAQFQIQNKSLEGGTFYFQWVHSEPSEMREPIRPISKRLHLIQVKGLNVINRQGKDEPIPKQRICMYKDSLTRHFYDLIWEHELSLYDEGENHSQVCSCQI